jgi:hypothetical protein
MQTNYEKAVEIYEAQGQSAVFDAVLGGTLTATSWHWCEPCECESPHEDKTCLVCGTKNDPAELKAKIADLLEDNHPAELERLTGVDARVCRKIVHELYPKDKACWEPESIGDGTWGIYGKNYAGEWIDKNGDYLCFDTKAEANQYIKETMK